MADAVTEAAPGGGTNDDAPSGVAVGSASGALGALFAADALSASAFL